MNGRLFVALGATLLLGGVAYGETVDDVLAEMARSKGSDYVAARDRLVSRPDARNELEAKLAAGTWSDETFSTLAMATIAHARVAHPDVVAKVNKLHDLDPSFYLLRRRPEPECHRELSRLGKDAVGGMLEILLKTFDAYPFSTAATLPAEKRDMAEVLASKERLALRTGLVMALAQSRHASALFVCKSAARDAAEPEAVRTLATEGLGTVGTKESFAALVALHADAPEAVKLAVVRGVARIPSAEALSFLEQRLAEGKNDRAVVAALGTFGSAWAWHARGAELQSLGNDLRKRAASRLVELVQAGKLGAGDSIVEALGAIAHPDSKAMLESVVADGTASAEARAFAQKALERVKMVLAR